MEQRDSEQTAYYAALATKRIGAGLVCRDAAARILLVRPTYKPTWEIPGGSVEADEAPAATVAREVREELGVALPIGRLLVVDWIPARPPKTEGLNLLFDGGVVEDSVTQRFSLPTAELAEWAFVDADRLDDRVSEGMARRLRAALSALRSGDTAYLEAGESPDDGRHPFGADPYAPLKDDAWRERAALDAQLERGEIDEAEWHAAMRRLIVPTYLAAPTPWAGSGKSGDAADWEYARSHIAHAIHRDGSFLDVGCANGYLLECLPRWSAYRLDRFGVDLAPELVDLARTRQPDLADHLFVGNALTWQPPRRFTYIRTGLEYVPVRRQRELVEHLLAVCDRLIIGVFNEDAGARPTEALLRTWGYAIAGRSERANRRKAGMEYRILWIDSP